MSAASSESRRSWRCAVGLHAWWGCTCDRCGKRREDRHCRCSECLEKWWADQPTWTCPHCSRKTDHQWRYITEAGIGPPYYEVRVGIYECWLCGSQCGDDPACSELGLRLVGGPRA